MTDTPPTALVLLSRLVPLSGPGIEFATLLAALHAHGMAITEERLRCLLVYAEAGEMVTCEAGRWRQRRVKL